MEEKRREYEQIKAMYDKEVNVLESNMKDFKDKIKKTQGEKSALENTTEDDLSKMLDSEIYDIIDEKVCKIYEKAAKSTIDKKGQRNPLQLLREMERTINDTLRDLKIYEKVGPDKVNKTEKEIMIERRNVKREI